MIWANLVHLGYNMWEDREAPGIATVEARRNRPYLRCDDSMWLDLTKQMARAGMNMIVIDLAEGVRYQSHPELAVEGSWTTARLCDELQRLRSLGLEPIPKLNFSTAHDAWLKEYSFMVSTTRYYEVVRNLIVEVCALFDKPRFFHLGMDEETACHQKYYSCAVVRQHELWWHDLYFMIEQVEDAGGRPWVWADYMWKHAEEFSQKMPRSVVQSNWYYGEEFENFTTENNAVEVGAYRRLEELGFDQIPTGSNWSSTRNLELTVDFSRKHIDSQRLLGFMMAPWRPTIEEYRDYNLAAVEQVKTAKNKPNQ